MGGRRRMPTRRSRWCRRPECQKFCLFASHGDKAWQPLESHSWSRCWECRLRAGWSTSIPPEKNRLDVKELDHQDHLTVRAHRDVEEPVEEEDQHGRGVVEEDVVPGQSYHQYVHRHHRCNSKQPTWSLSWGRDWWQCRVCTPGSGCRSEGRPYYTAD